MNTLPIEKWSDRQVEPIKGLKVHYTTKEMDDILYRINDILYLFKNLPVLPEARTFLKEKITEAGTELKKLSFTLYDKKIERKNEILSRLRDLYSKVNESSFYPSADEYKQIVDKTNKYLTALYIKDKKEDNLTEDKQIEWIKKLKLFASVYPACKNLESVQTELLQNFRILSNFE